MNKEYAVATALAVILPTIATAFKMAIIKRFEKNGRKWQGWGYLFGIIAGKIKRLLTHQRSP